MGVTTQQHTQARLEASFARIVEQAEARLNANQMTFRGVMTERADAHEAKVHGDLLGLQLQLNNLLARVAQQGDRLAYLERPWWKRFLDWERVWGGK